MANQTSTGTLKTFDILIDGTSVYPMISQTEIFQDIFLPVWSCNLQFVDTQNLLMLLPIKVGSEITIKIETEFPNNKKKTLKFIVYKISDRSQLKQDTQGYTISGIHKAYFKNQKKRVSKSFKGQSIGSMIDSITSDFGLGSLQVNDVKNPLYSIIVPNMSPLAAISWLSKQAVSSGISDLVYYMSGDGVFKLRSLEKMFNDRSGIEFKQTSPNRYDDSGNVDLEHFYNIEHYEFITNHDSMSGFNTGYYGSKVISYEISNKSYNISEFNIGDDISSDKTKGSFSGEHFTDVSNSFISFNGQNEFAFENSKLTANDSDLFVGSRKSSIKKFDDNRLILVVPGVVDHFDIFGKQIDVNLPSNQDEDLSKPLDEFLKGSYVVMAIKHIIKDDQYSCILESGKKRLDKSY